MKRRLVIRGKRWHIIFGRPPVNDCSAYCDPNVRTIWIRQWQHGRRITDQEQRECIIHEILHACFYDLREETVTEAEAALVKGLSLLP